MADWYCDNTNGNDSTGSGTSGSPYQTLQKCVDSATRGDTIYVEITDTGTGIREEDLNKIFDAFFTTKDSVKDVGLGLSVCYGFIKDHGGDIRVSSKWGSGTTFTITLPKHEESSG